MQADSIGKTHEEKAKEDWEKGERGTRVIGKVIPNIATLCHAIYTDAGERIGGLVRIKDILYAYNMIPNSLPKPFLVVDGEKKKGEKTAREKAIDWIQQQADQQRSDPPPPIAPPPPPPPLPPADPPLPPPTIDGLRSTTTRAARERVKRKAQDGRRRA